MAEKTALFSGTALYDLLCGARTKLGKARSAGQGGPVETAHHDKAQKQDEHEKTLSLVVHAPRFPDPKTFVWDKTMKVDTAATEAATAFGYAGGNPGLQTLDDPPRQLDPKKTLVAERLEDGDELEITDTGGGV